MARSKNRSTSAGDPKSSLDKAVLEAPPGDPIFEVWADSLLEKNDPRGELVSLCRELEKDPENKKLKKALHALVKKHAKSWCPGCVGVEELALTWKDGFVDTIDFRPIPDEDGGGGGGGYEDVEDDFDEGDYEDDDFEYEEIDDAEGGDDDSDEGEDESLSGHALRQLVAQPMAARLRGLSVCCPLEAEGNHGCWGSHESFVAHFLSSDRPWLRTLDFDGAELPRGLDHGRSTPELSFLEFGDMHDADVAVGDLRSLWKRAPRLEHLVIAQPNTVSLGTVVAPHLKTLVFGGPLPGAIKALASAKLPALEILLVRVSSAAQVKALLANHKLGVKHLGLIRAPGRNADPKPGDQLLEALVASPRIADLETLDLGGVSASPKGWERLAAAAPRMKKLREVRLTSWEIDPSVLDTDDWMDDVVEQLQGVNYRPKDEPIGKRLASALPVRWLPATVVSVDEEARKHRGWFRGMLWGGEGYAEDRRRV